MIKGCVLGSFLPTLCLGVLASALAYPQPGGQDANPLPTHLYQVSTADEKSGGKRVGFIDRRGKLVIGFDRLPAGAVVGEFSEGLATLCLPAASIATCRAAGYIDASGGIVIEPRFRRAGKFSEGLAYVEAEGLAGFINRRGEIVIKLKADGAPEFHDGLAAVKVDQGWGFIDRSGKLVTKESYVRVERFSEGLAAVAVGDARSARYGFINKEGRMVIPARFDPGRERHGFVAYLSRFSEGLASVKVDDLYGYIDKQGNFVIPPRFPSPADFSEGLACVAAEGGAGYVDKTGRWIITPRFAGCGDFKEGLAPVALKTADGTKWGYVGGRGEMVIKPQFDGAFPFVGGVAEVYTEAVATHASGRLLKTRRGYIDRSGKYIWEPQ